MKQGESNIKDTEYFLEKLKRVDEIPKGAILVTADVVAFYPSIPHDGGLEWRLEARRQGQNSSH